MLLLLPGQGQGGCARAGECEGKGRATAAGLLIPIPILQTTKKKEAGNSMGKDKYMDTFL